MAGHVVGCRNTVALLRSARRIPFHKEIIAIVDEERTGFDEMEAMALVSLFWRRRRLPIAKTER
jgi:hypothetical protein